ncbi:hypothetical protein KAT24_00105 [Candidatus Pacearchaeota archaeon]|nr:hypothetical protein [Candidatus Pacearchaeota archaeon]
MKQMTSNINPPIKTFNINSTSYTSSNIVSVSGTFQMDYNLNDLSNLKCTSFLKIDSINTKTESQVILFPIREHQNSFSHLIFENTPRIGFRKINIRKEVYDYIQKNNFQEFFLNSIDEIDDILIREEKDYLIDITINETPFEEEILIRIFLHNKQIGTLMNFWNQIQDQIYDEISKLQDKEKQEKLKRIISVKVIDSKNGYEI